MDSYASIASIYQRVCYECFVKENQIIIHTNWLTDTCYAVLAYEYNL